MSGAETEITNLDLSLLLHHCLVELETKVGLIARETTERSRVLAVSEKVGKTFYNTYLSPHDNDYFDPEILWLILSDKAGNDVGLVGSVHKNTGSKPLATYYRERLSRQHPTVLRDFAGADLQPNIANLIKGRVCYFGDLFVIEEHRHPSTNYLEFVMLVMFLLARIKWSEVEWMYSFLRAKDLEGGAAYRYGFTRTYPNASSWGVGVSGNPLEYGLAVLPRSDLDELLRRHLAARDRLAIVDEAKPALRVAHPKVKP